VAGLKLSDNVPKRVEEADDAVPVLLLYVDPTERPGTGVLSLLLVCLAFAPLAELAIIVLHERQEESSPAIRALAEGPAEGPADAGKDSGEDEDEEEGRRGDEDDDEGEGAGLETKGERLGAVRRGAGVGGHGGKYDDGAMLSGADAVRSTKELLPVPDIRHPADSRAVSLRPGGETSKR